MFLNFNSRIQRICYFYLNNFYLAMFFLSTKAIVIVIQMTDGHKTEMKCSHVLLLDWINLRVISCFCENMEEFFQNKKLP